jgi:hypothetical protein
MRAGDASRVRDVAGWPVAFRSTAAVAAGLVTPDMLRGPRPLPDTNITAPDDGPPRLALRSHVAYRYVEGRGCSRATPPPRFSVPRAGRGTPRPRSVDRLANVHCFYPDLLQGERST